MENCLFPFTFLLWSRGKDVGAYKILFMSYEEVLKCDSMWLKQRGPGIWVEKELFQIQ